MRKAFDNNIPRRRPKLRRAAAVEGLAPSAGVVQPLALVSSAAAPPPPPQAAFDTAGRRERLEKIKRKVAEIAAPAPRVELEKIRHRVVRPAPPVGPLPAVPTRAPDNVLSRMEALGAELAHARQREEALRGELHAARGELARTAGEAWRLAAAYADYLLQVAIRQRTQFGQESGRVRPAAVLGGASRGAAEREAKQAEILGRISKASSAAGTGLNQSPQRALSDPKPRFYVLPTGGAIDRGQPPLTKASATPRNARNSLPSGLTTIWRSPRSASTMAPAGESEILTMTTFSRAGG